MVISVYLPILCAAALAALSRPIARRSPPALAARLLTAGSLVIAASTLWAVGLLVLLRLSLEPELAAGGHLARSAILSRDPVPAAITDLAVAVLIAIVAVSIAIALRRTRAARALGALAADCRAAGDLVILPCEEPVAVALPGTNGRIVISTGMLRNLDAPGRTVLLAHERSHLHHRHDRFRTAMTFAAAINPLLLGVAGDVRYALERWADEDAALKLGDRRHVARTLLTAARTAAPPRTVRPGFAFGSDRVIERVHALHQVHPSPRASLLVVGVLPALLCAVGVGDATCALARLLITAHQ